MVSTLTCEDLRKTYDDQDAPALGSERDGVSFEVADGELFAFLGPSGCGKTTTLRIVGGFAQPDTGRVEIDGVDVTRRAPYERPTNTVFQSYALFPHMRVDANVGFGLKLDRISRRERTERASAALRLVGLGGYERRRVTELSGGQQQRAALARALVNEPSVLLLDEPLGALDLKLRRQMQDELVRLKRSTATTFVHVTHDQEEACAIADRIAVMNDGQIVQVDTPTDLYRHPRTTFVAEFINAGTVVRGAVRRTADSIELTHEDFVVRGPAPGWLEAAQGIAAVLPHDRAAVVAVDAGAGRSDTGSVIARVERVVFTGSVFDVLARTTGGLELSAALRCREPGEIVPGALVEMTWAPEDIVFVADEAETR